MNKSQSLGRSKIGSSGKAKSHSKKAHKGSRVMGFQDPHSLPARTHSLEAALGRQVKIYRQQMGLTVAQIAKMTKISVGMISKIENGQTSPSLATIQALSEALRVPVTSLFRLVEEERSATFIKAGHGLTIERRGTRAGHQYQLLGHNFGSNLVVEPYLITLTADSDVFPLFQHEGSEFIYLIEGEVDYRHGSETFKMKPGDSLFFDADVPHGPETLIKLPIRFICVISYARQKD